MRRLLHYAAVETAVPVAGVRYSQACGAIVEAAADIDSPARPAAAAAVQKIRLRLWAGRRVRRLRRVWHQNLRESMMLQNHGVAAPVPRRPKALVHHSQDIPTAGLFWTWSGLREHHAADGGAVGHQLG